MRTMRACPLHICFTPKPGKSRAQVELPDKGQKPTKAGLARVTGKKASNFG
jgi:hypothetical protein